MSNSNKHKQLEALRDLVGRSMLKEFVRVSPFLLAELLAQYDTYQRELARLRKIEEAAKRCDFEGLAEYFDTEQFIYKRWGGERGSCELQNDLRALDAALKQGNQ